MSVFSSRSKHKLGKLFFAAAFGGSDLPLGSEQGAFFSSVMSLGAISFLLKIETHIYISGFFLSSEQKTLENGFDLEVFCIFQRTAGSKQLIEGCGLHQLPQSACMTQVFATLILCLRVMLFPCEFCLSRHR